MGVLRDDKKCSLNNIQHLSDILSFQNSRDCGKVLIKLVFKVPKPIASKVYPESKQPIGPAYGRKWLLEEFTCST